MQVCILIGVSATRRTRRHKHPAQSCSTSSFRCNEDLIQSRRLSYLYLMDDHRFVCKVHNGFRDCQRKRPKPCAVSAQYKTTLLTRLSLLCLSRLGLPPPRPSNFYFWWHEATCEIAHPPTSISAFMTSTAVSFLSRRRDRQ